MSENKSNFKTIQQYFADAKKFIIPYYQRGYKWGVPNQNGTAKCSVEKLMQDIINAFQSSKFQSSKTEYFLQGVTVSENTEGTILIDGQQRTTTLFLLLHYLRLQKVSEFAPNILEYKVRKKSHEFLKSIFDKKEVMNISEIYEKDDKDSQDIFYFKKALETIHKSLEKVDKPNFTKYLLENVKIIYINILEENAVKSFTMLNGQKAKMTDEELIKAKLLSESSRAEANAENTENTEWEVNELRSKYAREWDKWLYWWNRTDVKDFFGTNNTMGLLLEIYFQKNKSDKKDEQNKEQTYSFNTFASEFIKNKKQAKETFLKIRKLQKHFEDWFNDAEIYNYLGLAFNAGQSTKKEIILWCLGEMKLKTKEEIKKFSVWNLIVSYEKCKDLQTNKDDLQIEAENILGELSGKYVYQNEEGKEGVAKSHAYKQLLRMNVMGIGNKKFEFNTFKTKSLEHISPQTPNDELSIKNQKDIEENSNGLHSIGNLVLLDGSTNSSLSNNPFLQKKNILFQKITQGFLLPHTLIVFSKSFQDKNTIFFNNDNEWNAQNVEDNAEYFINNFKTTYNIK
ncbi:MAG: DUF262 domain-containing protein [Bacteroidetes bacterium]|nr:MAG: DUF262 domain-containing protein [Bacteroidota bacterium]